MPRFREDVSSDRKPDVVNVCYVWMNPDVPLALPVVLVVEDEGFVRLMAVDMLEDAGFEVLEAGRASEAWAILEHRPDVDVLFTDVDMPGSMNGFDLAGRVNERWPHIRLVITSGRHWPRNDELPDHGQFVHKPYRMCQLVSAIGNAG